MPTNNKSIHILRGNASTHGNEVLDYGQPFYDTNTNTIKIGGKGGTTISATPSITVADAAITTDKLCDDSVINEKIMDNTIYGSKLADANGSTATPSGITASKIEDNEITTSKIAQSAVTTDKIANYNVTPEKLDNSGNYYVESIVAKSSSSVFAGLYGTGISYTTSKFKGNFKFPERNLATGGEIIATLNNIPKFQSIDGNLYITT